MLESLVELVSASGWTYVLVLAVAALDAVFPVVPSEATAIAAGVVAGAGDLSIALVVAAAAAGAFAGDSGAYAIGRSLGPRATRRLPERRVAWAERKLRAHAAMLILVARFVPGGRTVTMTSAGAVGLPWLRFERLAARGGRALGVVRRAARLRRRACVRGRPAQGAARRLRPGPRGRAGRRGRASRGQRAATITGSAAAKVPPPVAKDAFTQQDIAFHRETAAAYDDEITAEYGIYHEYSLAPFVEKLARERPNGRVLDLGCGTGAVTLRLAERGLRVNGVDHSPEMLELARAKAAERGLAGRIELETGDVRELRFGDAEFDGVTCQGLLHHLEDIDPCLGELARVLNPGGRFYISEPTTAVAPPKRVLMALWRGAKRVRRGRGVAPAAVDTVEQPIQPRRLLSALDRLGLDYDVEYLSHLPRLHGRIPDRARLALERAISRPWKRRQGDLIFVQGSKRPSSTPNSPTARTPRRGGATRTAKTPGRRIPGRSRHVARLHIPRKTHARPHKELMCHR